MATLKLHSIPCGDVSLPFEELLDGRVGQASVPVLVHLIQHPRGLVLFDSGLSPHIDREMTKMESDQFSVKSVSLVSALRDRGIAARDIRTVVISHFHFDHVGGAQQFENAQIIVQKNEWDMKDAEEFVHENAYINPAQDYKVVDGEYDIFGDGVLRCVPTPGHTAGHQSLMVKTNDQHICLASDCCYLAETLKTSVRPKHAYDFDQFDRSLKWLRKQCQQGVQVMPGHELVSLSSDDLS